MHTPPLCLHQGTHEPRCPCLLASSFNQVNDVYALSPRWQQTPHTHPKAIIRQRTVPLAKAIGHSCCSNQQLTVSYQLANARWHRHIAGLPEILAMMP